ncbi:hypothetical protein REH65_31450 [Saccharopolyspora sp. ID03-671]|uniref:hypothetical protein n=1 Tax=Saccharopolyspora sp. ID03-671 TaxID=3073066 RepID=UPI003253FE8A
MTSTALSDHLHEVLPEVQRLRQRFAATAPQQWDAVTAAAELSAQVGHLSLCLLRQHGTDVSDYDDPHRPIVDIGDELADIVLAALSIPVLAHFEPATPNRSPQATNDVEALLRLLVAAGGLSEAAMVHHRYRHRTEGTPRTLSTASASVIAACDELARQLGLNPIGEFRAMVNTADQFLNERTGTS